MKQTKIKKTVLGYGKLILMVLLLAIALESGYWYLFFLGLMCYGAWIKRDLYVSFIQWYKMAFRHTWETGDVPENPLSNPFGLKTKLNNTKKKKGKETAVASLPTDKGLKNHK